MPPLSRSQFDIPRIAEALFAEPVRSRLLRAYAIEAQPDSPQELCEAIWSAFGQASTPAAHRKTPTTNEVFRAAARAVGSNSRNWASFIRHEAQLNTLLTGGPEPVAARSSDALHAEIKACLPGFTSRNDARAILNWAQRLTDFPGWGSGLDGLRRTIRTQLGPLAREELDLPMVAIVLGEPRAKWPGWKQLPLPSNTWPLTTWKTPGMGAVLASEFLRNLHWPGFKPDRHIIRLVTRWAPELVEAKREEAEILMKAIMRRDKATREFLQVNLAALELTPSNMDPSQVDNLVWALGAKVEKKGIESTRPFLVARR